MIENCKHHIIDACQKRYTQQLDAIGMAGEESMSAPILDIVRDRGFFGSIPSVIRTHRKLTAEEMGVCNPDSILFKNIAFTRLVFWDALGFFAIMCTGERVCKTLDGLLSAYIANQERNGDSNSMLPQ